MSRRINNPPKWVHHSGDTIPLTLGPGVRYTITEDDIVFQIRTLGNKVGWYTTYRPTNFLSRVLFKLGVYFL
jgi:hypothetical protein